MSHDVFYKSLHWRRCRREHLDEHPWCAVCAFIGYQTEAVDVDHVIDRKLYPDPYDHANLRSLCKQHHSQKTILTEGVHKGKKEFQLIGVDGYPVAYNPRDLR